MTANRTNANLDTALTATAAEITRTDAKAASLLTLHGLLVAALGIKGSSFTGAAAVFAIGGAVALVAGLLVAIDVIRPRLGVQGTNDRSSFVYWATAAAEDIEAGLAEDGRMTRLQVLSRIALRKMRRLQISAIASAVSVIAIAAAILSR